MIMQQCPLSLKNQKKLLNDSDNESPKFTTKKWYASDDQNGADYGEDNENGTSIKFETKNIKLSYCNYSDAYVLVTVDITATNDDENTNFHLKIVLHLEKA